MTAPKTTKLGTKLTFTVYDLQGQGGFPQGAEGLAYEHLEKRIIHCKYTGLPINRDERYILRTDDTGKGWRIDRIVKIGPNEAVYGLGESRLTYWASAKLAAKALSEVLDEIANNSSIA